MYTPKYFKTDQLSLVHQIIEQNQFATLISKTSNEMAITHLPLYFRPNESEHGVIYGHLARANSQWKDWKNINRVTAIFHGPHAYISPRWYEPAPDNVPTWNYAAVHVHGSIEILNDSSEAYSVVKELVEINDTHWKLELSERDRKGMMAAIVVFRINVETIEATFKLSQNHPLANRESVIKNLSNSAGEMDRRVASLMRKINSSQT